MATTGRSQNETQSLLMPMMGNYPKAIIDNMQQNGKCWFSGERYETINHPVSECSKLTREYE